MRYLKKATPLCFLYQPCEQRASHQKWHWAHSFIHSINQSIMLSFIHSFIHSSNKSINHAFIHYTLSNPWIRCVGAL